MKTKNELELKQSSINYKEFKDITKQNIINITKQSTKKSAFSFSFNNIVNNYNQQQKENTFKIFYGF